MTQIKKGLSLEKMCSVFYKSILAVSTSGALRAADLKCWVDDWFSENSE